MNTREEIVDAIKGQYKGELPPPVVFTQTGTVGQMEACGTYWPDANYDTDMMVRLASQASEMFGFATARVPFDITEEAEALGCDVYRGLINSQPSVVGSPWRREMEICDVPDHLPSVDEFLSNKRITTVLESAGRLRDKGLFTTSMCLCSAGVVSHLLGMENMMIGMFTDPESVMKWVHAVEKYSRAYAKELSSVSDNVMIISNYSSDLISPAASRPFTEIDARQLSEIESFTTIHNCGDTYDNIDVLVSLKPDVLSLETSSNPKGYMEKVNGRCRMLGCVNAVRTLLSGGPADVLNDCRTAVELGFDLVGPECGIPPMTPNENIRTIAEYRSLL